MGIKMGLGIDRTLTSFPCEIIDYSNALGIANGKVKEKNTRTFDEVMGMK